MGPPVQEMSDARQAIVAAAAAGATRGSSPEYDAAQAAIARAETHLQAQEFARARLAALQAKHHAAAALEITILGMKTRHATADLRAVFLFS